MTKKDKQKFLWMVKNALEVKKSMEATDPEYPSCANIMNKFTEKGLNLKIVRIRTQMVS